MKHYDVIVVGAGPSAAFLAYEMIQLDKTKKVLLIEQGKKVEDRNCPIEKLGKCIHCKPMCNITCGFSGAGAFSDGKLSLYNEEDDDIYIGGVLHEYIGVEETKRLIDYTDEIYLKFGADTKLEGVEYKEEVKKIYDKAKKEDINFISMRNFLQSLMVEGKVSALDILMEEEEKIAAINNRASRAVDNYKKFKLCTEKTVSSIIMTCITNVSEAIDFIDKMNLFYNTEN